MEETDWAYLAGLIDGEAYLNIFLHTNPYFKRTTKEGYAREFKLEIASSEKLLLDEVRKRMENTGIIMEHKRTVKDSPNAHSGYTLRFSHNQLRIILPKIIPYLILKKNLAQLMKDSLGLRKGIRNYRKRVIETYRIDLAFNEEKKRVCKKSRLAPKADRILEIEKQKVAEWDMAHLNHTN